MRRLLPTLTVLSVGIAFSATAAEKYCRFADHAGATHYARVDGDTLLPLDAAPWSGGKETGVRIALADAKLLPPSEPRNILCLANSYAGKDPNPPAFIRWFAKSNGAAATDGDPVAIPPIVDQLKTEAEVVLIVGRRLRNATEDEARAAIFGYAVGNELFGFPESFQRLHGDAPGRTEVMLAAGLKLGDHFAPFGPFIERGSEWKDRRRVLSITNSSTGKSIEHASDTKGLLYPPAKILTELSRVLTLEPGDIVFTGSDRSFIVDAGDTITIEIEGLGKLTNRIVKP